MSLNGDPSTRGTESEVILVVSDELLPAMQADPVRVWLVCECGEELGYVREYGLGEAPAAFFGFLKAGLADAYNIHLLEEHDD